MELAKKDKRKYVTAFFFSLIFVVGFMALSLIFLLGKQYSYMLVSLLFFALGSLVSLFTFSRYRDAKAIIKIIRTVNYGEARWRSVQGVACTMGWSEKATRKFIKKCVRMGYVRL